MKKKLMALLVAMVMVMGLALNVSAASITITPGDDATGTVSTEYTYYEILKASISEDETAYSYYLPVSDAGTALKNLVDAVSITKEVDGTETTIDVFSFAQSADGTRWVATVNSAITESDGEAIAEALNTDAIKSAALAHDTFEQDGGSAVAEGLDPGYYLITSTLGTKLVLQTLGDEEIVTKNSYPSTGKTASKTNMNVGDIVTYTVTVTIPATTKVGETFTVHDTIDEHLALLNASDEIATTAADYAINAVIGGTTTAVTLTDGTLKTGETFAKQFTATQAMIDAGSVVLTYKAELLSTAADDTGYVNEAYTNTPSYETLPDDVPVFTFDMDVDKTFTGVTGDAAEDYVAKFELRTDADDAETAIEFISDATGYVKADSNDTGASTVLEINGKDVKNIRGLAAGTYYLVETETMEGYNLLAEPVVVTIEDTTDYDAATITPAHEVSYTFADDEGTGTVAITNQAGSVLPSTGGVGTTIFYVVGAVLVLGAGVLMVTRRRMSN